MNIISIILDILCLLICSIVLFKSLKTIGTGKYSIFHLCCVIFYLMQVLPLAVSFFGDLSGIEKYYPYMYSAMTDLKVNIIYLIFCIITMLFLYFSANKFNKKYNLKLNITKFKSNENIKIISLICFLLIFGLLIFGVVFSPKPTIYTKFAYFYTNDYLNTSKEYLYHINTMNVFVRISFILTIIYYYFNSTKKGVNFIVLVATFLITWLNGKRTLLLFLLFSFVIIDFIKLDKNDKAKFKKIIKKLIIFIIIFIAYYLIYNKITQKSNFADGYLLYSTYFSRMSNVKTSIYSLLYDQNMLNYSGETLLFDIFFYVPRSIWTNKPLPFFTQFTSYVFYGKPNLTVSNMQFQVNMWSEFISNLNIIGYILALMFTKFIIRKSEKSNDIYIYFSGMLFILLYFVYGFEKIEQIVFIFWVLMLIKSKFKISKHMEEG